MYINVIEFNVDEFRLCVYVKRMYVARRNHKQMSVVVGKLVVVYPLDACAGQDINQLKKSMVVLFQS